VRDAVAELRAELERMGARGPLEALDRGLADAPTTTDANAGAVKRSARPSPAGAADQATARPSPA
jgi:hypothetical protein